MSVIQAQGTPEQIKKWYDPAKRLAIIGCYAQTELRLVSPLAFFCFVWFIFFLETAMDRTWQD